MMKMKLISISSTNEESLVESNDPVVAPKNPNILKSNSSCPDENTELLGDAKFVNEMGGLLLLSSTSNQLPPSVLNIKRWHIKARRNVKKRIESFSSTSESVIGDENPENDENDQSDGYLNIFDFIRRC